VRLELASVEAEGAVEEVSMSKPDVDNLGILPLAGICSYDDACRPGHSVDESVRLLKRFVYVESRLNKIFAAHIADTPEWEAKCAFGLHMYLDAEHSGVLRERVSEMREPPLHLDVVPDEGLKTWLDEVIRSETTIELLVGIYQVVKPELVRSIKRYLERSNPLADFPSRRLLQMILREEEEMVRWGEQAVQAVTERAEGGEAEANAWRIHLQTLLTVAGGVYGDLLPSKDQPSPELRSDGTRYEMRAMPRRDARFSDRLNSSALDHHIADIYNDTEGAYSAEEQVVALFYNRLLEMDVPEYACRVIHETEGKPWGYYADLSRHLWDETRHAMLGEAGFYRLGVPFYKYPIDGKSSVILATQFSPKESHVVLWGIEQALMPRRTGKGLQWDVAVQTGDEFAILMQDYDWADEVLHAQIGRKWLIPDKSSRKDLNALFEELGERFSKARGELPYGGGDFWSDLVAEVQVR